MPFIATAGFNSQIDAALSSASTQMLLPVAGAANLIARLAGNFSYLQIQDGLSYEIVRANSVVGQLVSIVRGVDGTAVSAFPRGASVSFVMGPSSVAALSGGGGAPGVPIDLTLSSTNIATALINGALTDTQALPAVFNVTVPQVSITGPGVTGVYPNFVVPAGGGNPSIVGDANLTINGIDGGTATAFPVAFGLSENWVDQYGFGSVAMGSSNNNLAPAISVMAFGGVTSPNTGSGVISGIALSATGRVFGVEVQSLPNGTFTNSTINVTNGRVTSVTAGVGGGGSVQSVAPGAGIAVTGTPNINPVVQLLASGVIAGNYANVAIDTFGRITSVPISFDPVSVVSSPTVGVSIISTSPGARQISIATATSSTQGLVEFADNTQLTSFASGVAASPADFRSMLNDTGLTVTQLFNSGGIGGAALTHVAASINIAGPHAFALITAQVQFLDPGLGAGLEHNARFAAGIYVNGAPVIVTDEFPGGLKSLSITIPNATGLVEVRTSTPTIGELVAGAVSVACLNPIP